MLTLTPIVGLLVAFALAWATTPLVVRLARRLGAMDPTTAKKIHAREIPRLGGLAIACGFYVPILGLFFRNNQFAGEIYQQPGRVVALLGGGLIILALGVFDDLRGAKAWQKLIVQVPVAVLAWWAGIRIGGTAPPGSGLIEFPTLLSLVVTVAWIVVVVNAINLIDGLDGLASGVALQALIVVALCAWHRESAALALFAICLAGSVGGFLVHNFHPASIFMGDSGSMLLGYVLAISTVWASQKAATMVGVVLPVVVLGLPLIDTSMAIWRRFARRVSILSGDLDHIHHRLLGLGWGQRRSVLALYGVSLFFNLLSIALIYVPNPSWHWPLVGVAVLAAAALAVALTQLRRRLSPGRGVTAFRPAPTPPTPAPPLADTAGGSGGPFIG